MKKPIVMFLIASFAVFGSVAYAHEGTTKMQSDSTLTKKIAKKKCSTSSIKVKSTKTCEKKAMTTAKKDTTKNYEMKMKKEKKESKQDFLFHSICCSLSLPIIREARSPTSGFRCRGTHRARRDPGKRNRFAGLADFSSAKPT